MPEKKEKFNPDLSSIEFPTDRITLGQIWKAEPELLHDNQNMSRGVPSDIDAIRAAQIERIAARQVWAKTIGMPRDAHYYHRHDYVGYLNDIYKMYGLSSGRKQTDEMVRGFESQVEKAAKQSIGQGRG
jgi:hypothetical protein